MISMTFWGRVSEWKSRLWIYLGRLSLEVYEPCLARIEHGAALLQPSSRRLEHFCMQLPCHLSLIGASAPGSGVADESKRFSSFLILLATEFAT